MVGLTTIVIVSIFVADTESVAVIVSTKVPIGVVESKKIAPVVAVIVS